MEIPKGYRTVSRLDETTHALTATGPIPCSYVAEGKCAGMFFFGGARGDWSGYLPKEAISPLSMVILHKIPKTPRVWQWEDTNTLDEALGRPKIPAGARARWVVTEILEDED